VRMDFREVFLMARTQWRIQSLLGINAKYPATLLSLLRHRTCPSS
jgi:hypothetical protein